MPAPGKTKSSIAEDASCDISSAAEQSDRQGESADVDTSRAPEKNQARRPEIGGREGLEPTRYGDWEFKGRCIDF